PPTLTNGASGAVVEKLQQELNAGRGKWAPTANPVLTVDGKYGPATTTAVEGAQRQGGIPVDGTVGPQTLPGPCGQPRSWVRRLHWPGTALRPPAPLGAGGRTCPPRERPGEMPGPRAGMTRDSRTEDGARD